MRTLSTSPVIGAALAVFGACTPFSPDLGPAPFLCGPADQEPRCPDGYTCMDNGNGVEACLAPGGTIPIDANNLNCANDSNLEPNDSITQAWVTPVDTMTKSFPMSGLAICPGGDKDTYSLTNSVATQNIEIIVEFETTGAHLQGAILNSSGTPIANASPVAGMAGHIRAYAPNMPVGIYYAQVFGPSSGSLTTNNYKLTINVTGP
jgi:hypothetical protein